MQNSHLAPRRTSGAKAITIDQRAIIAQYRVLQIIAVLLSAGFALGLHFVFGH